MIDLPLRNSSRGDIGVDGGRVVAPAPAREEMSASDPDGVVTMSHMSGDDELRTLIDMITVAPAAALGVADYGLHVGGSADPVVFDARSEAEALRLQAPRHLVLRAGKVLAGTRPARSFVRWHGEEEEVDFRPR
jgi:cytosine/adenosine deaminase-related metal-dependent hydrolase